MRRWLRIGRTVGFLLSGAIAGLWILSASRTVTYQSGGVGLRLAYGVLAVFMIEGTDEIHEYYLDNYMARGLHVFDGSLYEDGMSTRSWLGRLGLVNGSLRRFPPARPGDFGFSTAVVPLWMPFSAALLASVVTHYASRRPRVAPACCSNCGYDLTGNVSGRCPECGAAAEAKAGAGG